MYFDDDGNQINPAFIPMPKLCLNCEKKDDSNEQILCNLTRLDQRGDKEFKCYAYQSRYETLEDDIIF